MEIVESCVCYRAEHVVFLRLVNVARDHLRVRRHLCAQAELRCRLDQQSYYYVGPPCSRVGNFTALATQGV